MSLRFPDPVLGKLAERGHTIGDRYPERDVIQRETFHKKTRIK
jgi:hypothetical protein